MRFARHQTIQISYYDDRELNLDLPCGMALVNNNTVEGEVFLIVWP